MFSNNGILSFHKNAGYSTETLPEKIRNLIHLGENFFVPKSFYIKVQDWKNHDEIIKLYKTYIDSPFYIIRSATENEDGATLSHAGVFLSKVGEYASGNFLLDMQEVVDTIKKKDEKKSLNNAILIQEYIPGEFSGIYFGEVGCGNSSIEYVSGSNDLLTDGSVSPSCILIKNGLKIEHTIRYQKLRSNGREKDLYTRYPILPETSQLSIIKTLSTLCEYFHTPHLDIEWTWKNGALTIFQIRKISKSLHLSPKEYFILNQSEENKLIAGIFILYRFMRKIGFGESHIFFDYGGGLLGGYFFETRKEVRKNLLNMILSEKIYILLSGDDPLYEENFGDHLRQMRFKDTALHEEFIRLSQKTGINFIIAKLPTQESIEIFSSYTLYHIPFLISKKNNDTLLAEKNTQEDLGKSINLGMFHYTYSENLSSFSGGKYRVTKKSTPQSTLKNLVFIGFDIYDYDVSKDIALFILERKSHLCHGAILAREMNLPCIYGVENIVNSLSEGDTILINHDGKTIMKV